MDWELNVKLRLGGIGVLLFSLPMLGQTPSPAHKTPPAAANAAPGDYPVMSAAAKARTRQVFGYFEAGQAGALYTAFAPPMKKSTSVANLSALAKRVGSDWGHEQKMLGENFVPDMLSVSTVYSRFSQFSNSKDPIYTVLAVDRQGQVSAFHAQPRTPPPSANRYSDYRDKARLRLPFDGSWFVYEGGREVYQNRYVFSDLDRYSVVFTVLKDGQAFSGDGTRNEQFFCYGQPVMSPADGTVVMTVDKFADNPPGRSEEIMPSGNRVLIFHGHGEYSLFMHLKRQSITVKAGDQLRQGDVIGECGNSGNSPAPSLEYRLQNSKGVPVPLSLPAQFVNYVADGTPVAWGEPLRGQTVRNHAASADAVTTPTSDQN